MVVDPLAVSKVSKENTEGKGRELSRAVWRACVSRMKEEREGGRDRVGGRDSREEKANWVSISGWSRIPRHVG